MVSKSQVQTGILATSLLMAFACGNLYEYWQKNKPSPEIPVQSWDKYVRERKQQGKDY